MLITLVKVTINLTQAEPWWPRGYGEPKLYAVDLTFTVDDWPEEPQTIRLKTGFRTVELVQDTMPTGTAFDFII